MLTLSTFIVEQEELFAAGLFLISLKELRKWFCLPNSSLILSISFKLYFLCLKMWIMISDKSEALTFNNISNVMGL